MGSPDGEDVVDGGFGSQPAVREGPIDRPERTVVEWPHLSSNTEVVARIALATLAERALLLDHTDLVELTLARLEFHRRLEGVEVLNEGLLAQCIDEAINELLQQDYRRLDAGLTEACEGNDRDSYLVEDLGVHPPQLYPAVVAYHALTQQERRAFLLACRKDVALSDLVGGEWSSLEELRSDFMTALAALMNRPRPNTGA